MRKIWMKNGFVFALVMCAGIAFADVVTSFGVNFTTADDQNISTEIGVGFSKDGYAAPVNWTNVRGSANGNGTITLDDNTTLPLSWTAYGAWSNDKADKNTDTGKLLYGYLDDVVSSGRTKATVTIRGLPTGKKYAVALILSGDGSNSDIDHYDNRYSPVVINGVTNSYVVSDDRSNTNLVTGAAAFEEKAKKWGDRRKTAAAGGLVEGVNVMFVEGLVGTNLTITSAMENQNTSRLTIAGVQVWITDEVWPPLPEPFWTWDGTDGTQVGVLPSGEKVYTADNKVYTIESFDTKAFTYAFWGKLHTSNWQDLTGLATETAGFKLERRNGTDLLGLYSIGTTGLADIEDNCFTLSPSELEFFVVVNNAGTFTFYKNGEPIMDDEDVLTRTTTTWEDVISGEGKKVYIGLGCSPTISGGSERRTTSTFADVKLYESALTAEQIKAVYDDYETRANAQKTYTRTLSGETNWSLDGAWTDSSDDTQTVAAPGEGQSVEITVNADSTITMNESAALSSLTVEGAGKATFSGESSLAAVLTRVTADVDVSGVDASLGAVTVAEGKTLSINATTAFDSLSATGAIVEMRESIDYSQGGTELFAASGFNGSTYKVGAGTTTKLAPRANAGSGADVHGNVVVGENATLDLSGRLAVGGTTVTLCNGAILTTSDNVGDAYMWISWPTIDLAENAAAKIKGADFASVASGNGAHSWNLNGGTLEFDMNEDAVFMGSSLSLTNSGTVKVTSGLVEFARNAASAAGASFIVNGGTLRLATQYEVGSLSGTGGQVQINSSLSAGALNETTEFSGTLTGTGGFTKRGTGTLTLSGANTHTGSITVEGGTLKLFADGKEDTGAVAISEGATLELTGGLTINGDVTLAGDLKCTSGRTIIYGDISGEGTITVDGEGSVLGIGMVGYDNFTGKVVLKNGGGIVLPAGFETNHIFEIDNAATCYFALRLNHQQIFNGYTAQPPAGVTVKFYSETGSEVPAESVEGNTYRPTINTWEKGAWMRTLVAGEPILIYVSEDYTDPVQLSGDITLGTVKIEGVGSVSFSGGVLAASEIEVSTITNASEDAAITLTADPATMALVPMTIGERATVDYTFTSKATIPQLSGAGTFVKRGTADANLAPANEYGPTLVVAQGKMIFNEAYTAYDKTYNIVVNGGATLQVGGWLAKITSTASVYTLKAGATLFLNNGNTSQNIAGEVAASIVIDSTEDKPATITGSEYGTGSFISGGISGNGVLKLAQSSHKYRITGVIADGANDGDVLKVKVDSAEPDKLVLAAENTFSGGMEIAEGAMLTIANPKALGAGVATINGTLVLNNADIAIGSKVSGSGTITNTVAGGSVKFTEGGAIVPSYDGCLSIGSTLDASVVFDVSSLIEKSDKRFDLIRASSAETLPTKQFIESELKSYKRRILGDWKVVPVRSGIGWALQSRKFCVFVH